MKLKTTAQVVLINDQGQVLCVSRKDDHNNWGLPGGKSEPEDLTELDTAYRETFEETGLEVFGLRLVFATHKDGYMSYTYLAKYMGEINHNEPHVVKWGTWDDLIAGSFGKYNQLVYESLVDMGVIK